MSGQQPKKTLPAQHQNQQPGVESKMNPLPIFESLNYKAAGKLQGKVAIITGGDSGIGRATAVAFAKEGADLSVLYLNEHDDALETQRQVEQEGRKCILIAGDIGDEEVCKASVKQTMDQFGQIDILVNNAAEQHPQQRIEDITKEQLERTFQTNIFSMFYMTKVVMPHLKSGSSIINTASITAFKGNATLLDYSATKGAIVSFTRSLSMNVIDKGIRVNAVAPGPIWTPLIPSTFDAEKVSEFGGSQPMKRPGQPEEVAPAYVYLASNDSSYVSGQVIHVNGGEVVNG
ncbi:SDR family oxidoreductase [Paenibacillus glacialis]|uniref:NAD(P)-dependent oxidoreductase n=1 Tax=Paenibacillus glacialis TaxID=494026 RepID=A0A168LE23_9BACL|nr:SDR family oxidoreductase [Paenibacillus glacialis]OAB43261.1 NAD(P)-dependent oxidoreductase [Paenibacillus glacialis]